MHACLAADIEQRTGIVNIFYRWPDELNHSVNRADRPEPVIGFFLLCTADVAYYCLGYHLGRSSPFSRPLGMTVLLKL